MEQETFIAIVFPDDKAALVRVAKALQTELQKTTGETPQIVHPNAGAICLLIEGEYSRIKTALETSCGNDVRHFLARIDSPVAMFGLNSAHAWFQARARKRPQQ